MVRICNVFSVFKRGKYCNGAAEKYRVTFDYRWHVTSNDSNFFTSFETDGNSTICINLNHVLANQINHYYYYYYFIL